MRTFFAIFLLLTSFIADSQSLFDKESVKAIMDRVNKYQFENPWKEFDDNWIRGTYYTGVMACYQATGDKKYLEQCDALGIKLGWQIPSLRPEEKGSGVNLLTIGQTWLESYMIQKEEYKIGPVKAHLENPEIRNPISNPFEWYWEGGRRYVDGLFTGPPTLAMLYHITKDEKYLQWMEVHFWDIYGKLFDTEENLFYRDQNFFPDCREQRKTDPDWKGNHQVTAAGKKVLWSRGNGWAFAGIARILKYLPEDHPSYKRYEQLFKKMAQSLKNCQSEEGYWSPNLADPKDFACKETSGTGFFTYGLAYGINNGILDKNEYLPAVQKAWKSLYEAVNEEGKVQFGQIVGDRPVIVKKEDSHEFVTGTFLLAASEIYNLQKLFK
jgi:unsaturated rhamnogalacturonyl hydrolase